MILGEITDSTGVSLGVVITIATAASGMALWISKQLSDLREGQLRTHNQLHQMKAGALKTRHFMQWTDSLRDTNRHLKDGEALNVPGLKDSSTEEDCA